MSHTLLTQCVEEYNKTEPIDIYNQMRELINVRKEKWNDFLIEDLELSICSYKWDDFQLKYASNGNFLYLVKHVNNVDDLDEITVNDAVPNTHFTVWARIKGGAGFYERLHCGTQCQSQFISHD